MLISGRALNNVLCMHAFLDQVLPSDTPTLTAPEGAPPYGRPQRMASTKAPGASEPTESGTAEPKVEEKTEDKDPEGVVH